MKTTYSRIKNKAVNVAAKVISAPKVAYYRNKQMRNDEKADTLKYARETKNVDLTGKDYRDPIFRARASANLIKSDAERVAQGRKPLFE